MKSSLKKQTNPAETTRADLSITIEQFGDVKPEQIEMAEDSSFQEHAKPLEEDPRAVYDLVERTKWPITYTPIQPVFLDGREDIDKPFIMRLKENVWLSIDAHCKALGVTKSEWVRESIFRQLYEEQQYFTRNQRELSGSANSVPELLSKVGRKQRGESMSPLSRSEYAIVDLSELEAERTSDQLTVRSIGKNVDPAEMSAQLKAHGGPMVLIKMPDGCGYFQYEWEIWLAHALAHGVPEKLAILGRDVRREQYQHQWGPVLLNECGAADRGRGMIKMALRDPEGAKARWDYLIETDGEQKKKNGEDQ